MHPDLLLDGARIFWENLWGPKHKAYDGDAESICRQVVDDCWNGTYFKAGAGHLDQFWIRDLGWCVRDLVRLGHGERVAASLVWAMERYRKRNAITTTIFRMRTPYDIYTYACDSLPFFLYCCRMAGLEDLVQEHREFIQNQIATYVTTMVDPQTKLVRQDRYFSSCKDVMKYLSTCTSNCFLFFLRQEIRRFDCLKDPLGDDDASLEELARGITGRYWRGDHFINDDRSAGPFISADANVWPFWCGVSDLLEDGEAMLKAAVQSVGEAGLDSPFPIRYHQKLDRSATHPIPWLFIPNYQGDSIWTLLGPLWIALVNRVDPCKARKQLDCYTEHIEKHRTFVEVFEPDGSRPLKGRLGHGSAYGMLWASMYLGLRLDLLGEEPCGPPTET